MWGSCSGAGMDRTISVIVTVYNRFDLTKRAVESVLHQTLPVTEVLLIDDGSFDGTSESLRREIAANCRWRERVRYFYQENQGPGAARNNGIAKANGDWLAFIDNDDLWLPEKLAWQFRVLAEFQNESSACITDAWFMNNPYMKMTLFQLAGKEPSGATGLIPDAIRYILETNSVVGIHPVWLQNLVTRTDLARRVGGFDPELRFGDDDDFAFRLVCNTALCYVSMPLVLIDRTPCAERHVGASREWDNPVFRLRMAQYRYEKRLRMSDHVTKGIRRLMREDLAAVHSGWANWFLQQKDYPNARNAVNQAARTCVTPGVAIKWALTQCAPSIARKVVLLREERRTRAVFGIG